MSGGHLKPIMKWAGGKAQLLPEIRKRIPESFSLYVEPFVGRGSVFLDLSPEGARINDLNKEVIEVYREVRDNPNELIAELKLHDLGYERDGSDYYYAVRNLDRTSSWDNLTSTQRAARFLFLNKTGYNGLYRVNSSGKFNVPAGRYKHPKIVNEQEILAVHDYLARADVVFSCGDFKKCLEDLPAGAFVYLDPPYIPLSKSASFTAYTKHGFNYEDQVRLRDECLLLSEQGIHFLESNSDTPEIRELYTAEQFTIVRVRANRAIASNAEGRKPVYEVLISC